MPSLYRWLVRLFPPGFRERDGREAVEAFEQLWRDAPGPRTRRRLVIGAIRDLPRAWLAEWWHAITVGSAGPHDDGRGGRMEGWWRHVRMALRTLRRSPAFAWSSLALVALGVGAVTTIFTIVDHVLLRPLPYPEPDRLVLIENGSHSGPFWREIQGMATVEDWAGAFTTDVNLTGEGDPLRFRQAWVTPGFFEPFGARAQRGRLLAPEDFTRLDGVVISDGAWRRVWGADPDIVGRTVELDGRPVTVLGVLARDFAAPEAAVGGDVELWRPIDWSREEFQSDNFSVLQIVGRLAEGSAPAAADAELEALVERLATGTDRYRTRDGRLVDLPVTPLSEVTVRGVRTGLGLLLGAVGLLLLVACANVAHLFLARGLGRQREMAVRRAMGADTGSLVGQLMVESLVIGALGGLLGTGLAWLGLRGFLALNPTALPREGAVTLDLRVLGFAVVLSALTAVLFGLLPALRSVGTQVSDELRGAGRAATAGRGANVLRSGLVVAEVALSLVLVASAGLLLRSFLTVQSQDAGFDTAGVWTVPLTPTGAETPEAYRAQMDEVRASLASVPGVRSATYGLTMPMEMTGGGRCCWGNRLQLEGRDEPTRVSLHPVTVHYFETLRLELVEGRTWTDAESGSDPMPVVVTEPLATAVFGSAAAAVNRPLSTSSAEMLVVGVAVDNHHYGLENEHGPAVYLPMERLPFGIPKAHAAVRVEGDAPAGFARTLREAVWAAAPGLPVPEVRSMDDWIARSTAGRRFDSALFGAFAVVALLLAAGGLYGTQLYVAGQRRRELGIRLALGASRGRIERQVLRSGLAVATLGVLAGLAGAWTTARLLESRLWGVDTQDPWALGAASAVLLGTALLASWLPARRAGRTDPLETLRTD